MGRQGADDQVSLQLTILNLITAQSSNSISNFISVTPLQASFMHAPNIEGEIKL